MNKSKKEQEDEMDTFDTMPSQKELFSIVKDLAYRVSNLEAENKTLRKYALKEHKKIDILDWLNTRSGWRPTQGFRAWVISLPFANYLDVVFENDLVYGITRCVVNAMREPGQTPMTVVSQKRNVFYIYDKQTEDAEKACWFVLTNECFCEWIDYISRQFFKLFRQWFEKQCEENSTCLDELNDKKTAYYRKLLGGKVNEETRNQRILTAIYTTMKLSAKSVHEFA